MGPLASAYGMDNVSSGANDGLLSLVAHTRNQAGIAARSPLALNFGEERNFAAAKERDVDKPDAKKIRGVLDSHFTRVAIESIPCSAKQGEGGGREEQQGRGKGEGT